ncbi:DUF5615 family PIN-like protein [Pandoraea communis]|uniref:DUF5615 family PIN-like protein n=1 Tax=Pandoraea communis TaxID=2508297 RepID=UPI0025A61E79|nr:DUF5615 family PIN-like protein [Pandoraea communis]MDM8359019.1 DUF5615 family PIN-like protein [Pandoraea communis]
MARWIPINTKAEEIKLFVRQFRKKARFLVDENMGEAAADLLRSLGCRVTFVGDVGLRGKSDETVFAYAWKKRLIILTHDSDFLDDKAFPYHRNPGVIVLPGAEGDGMLERALIDVVRLVSPYGEVHAGEKISVSVDRVWTMRRFDKAIGKHVKWRVRLVGWSAAHELIEEQASEN